MVVQLGNETIEVVIVRKNNKNVYFRFKEDGKLYVSCHPLVGKMQIEKMIKSNQKSILKMYEGFRKQKEKELQYYYLGKPYVLIFDESIKKAYIEDDFIYIKDEKMLRKFEREECIRVFQERMSECEKLFPKPFGAGLKIRKMTTRWGVNNVTKRVITLNSELLKKDIDLIDYVVIHEYCHFYEANHSKKFWEQVAIRYPDYKEARKRLRS